MTNDATSPPTSSPSADLDAFLDALPKPTTPEAEGLPPCTPEGLTTYVKAHAKPLREGEKPAMRWDELLTAYEKADCTVKQIEDALEQAMDDGLLYEPILGVLAVGSNPTLFREATT